MSKEHWDKSFSDKDYVYGETENEFINKMSGCIPKHSNISCFAEGEGRNAVYLAKNGHEVTAYDQSAVGLSKARKLAEEQSVTIETIEMDLTNEKVEENKYDAAIMVFGHVPKKDQPYFIENIAKSVKSGGYIIFEVYSEEQINYGTGGPRSVDMLYDPVHILNWLKEYKFLHFYYGEAERIEGKKHTGLCHVIQVVIKK